MSAYQVTVQNNVNVIFLKACALLVFVYLWLKIEQKTNCFFRDVFIEKEIDMMLNGF